jgi:hypothetical protein
MRDDFAAMETVMDPAAATGGSMNRRSFVKGLAAVGASLVLPPTLEENAEAVQRFWALDRTMVPGWVETHGYGVVPITDWIHAPYDDRYIIEVGQLYTPAPMRYIQVFPK